MTKEIPVYLAYRDVPFDMTYPSAWRQRGYGIRQGERPIARLRYRLDDQSYDLPLYGLSQTRRLRGPKAKHRRTVFIAALYTEE